MSEENVVRLCAPTLAGIKTGSLFPCPFENRETLLMEIRQYNQVLVPKGLCLLPLRFTDKSALLYLYRPAELRRDLESGMARDILQKAGYRCDGCQRCVARLIRRFREEGEFPHEVGLFLSYPPEDVQGFIEQVRRSLEGLRRRGEGAADVRPVPQVHGGLLCHVARRFRYRPADREKLKIIK